MTPSDLDLTGQQRGASAGHQSRHRCARCNGGAFNTLGWRKRRIKGMPGLCCPKCVVEVDEAVAARKAAA